MFKVVTPQLKTVLHLARQGMRFLKGRPWVIMVSASVLGLLLLVGTVSLMKSASSPSHGMTPGVIQGHALDAALGQKLNDIAAQLAQLNAALTHPKPAVDTHILRLAITRVNEQVKSLAEETHTLVRDAIKQSTAPLTQQLAQVTQRLKALQKAEAKVRFIPPSHLPFHVVSIDNIQQHNVVTVRYNHTTFPLMEGDEVAGWRLIKTHFSDQRAEFVNQQQAHTQVVLNHYLSTEKTA